MCNNKVRTFPLLNSPLWTQFSYFPIYITNTEQGHKPSMVAEPMPRYPIPVTQSRFPSRHAGI